jgi:hypothetical protein
MPRNHKAKEIAKIARAKRDTALERAEFRYPSEARVSADSPTSFAVKDVDAGTAAMIADFLAKRGASA